MELLETGRFWFERYYSEVSPQRRVRTFELELVERGEGMTFIDGVSYPHCAGRLIIAKPGQMRFTVGPFSCWYLHVLCDEREAEMLRALPDAALYTGNALKGMMMALHEQHTSGKASYFAIQAALFSVWQEATADVRSMENGRMDHHASAILSAKAYLDEHYGESIRLDELAAQAHLSKNFFRAKFCQLMGLSPREYLGHVRLTHAMRLLQTTDQSLSDIAMMCGYESQSYMNYVFKRETGRTPLRFRRKE